MVAVALRKVLASLWSQIYRCLFSLLYYYWKMQQAGAIFLRCSRSRDCQGCVCVSVSLTLCKFEQLSGCELDIHWRVIFECCLILLFYHLFT